MQPAGKTTVAEASREIDWPAVRQALVDVGYEGWISAEVGFGDLTTMKDVVRRMNQVLGMG